MRDKMKVAIGVGALVGLGVATEVLVHKYKKKGNMQKNKEKVQKNRVPDLETREFRCVRDARYYNMIVDMFRGDSASATLWMVENYEYPYNYSQIYEDIKSGKVAV